MAESELSSLESVSDDEDESPPENVESGKATSKEIENNEQRAASDAMDNLESDGGVIDISENLPDTPDTPEEGKGRVAHADRVACLLSQCYKDCRHLVRLRIFKSITRHIACCSADDFVPDKENLPNDVVIAFIHAYEAAPKRHQVQFIAPAQDLLFCLKQIESQCQNIFIQPDLIRQVNMIIDRQSEPPLACTSEISNDLAAPLGNLPTLPPAPASLSSTPVRSRTRHGVASRKTGRVARYFQDQAEEVPIDLNLPPERPIHIVQPAIFTSPPVSHAHAIALLGNMGAIYNLNELVNKAQQNFGENEPAMAEQMKDLLAESHWFYTETDSKPLEALDFMRVRQLAQLINSVGSHIWGPRPKMPALFQPQLERTDAIESKRRRIDGRPTAHDMRHFPNTLPPISAGARHSGRPHTIWESLQVRKVLHIEDVESLWLLKDSLAQADLNYNANILQIKNGKVIDQDYFTFYSRPTPSHILKAYGEIKVADWERDDHLSFCGLCGAAFRNLKEKQSHLKAHFIRVAPYIPLILSPRGDLPPPRLLLGPWLPAKHSMNEAAGFRNTEITTRIARSCGTNVNQALISSVETVVKRVSPNKPCNIPDQLFVPLADLKLEPEQAICGICRSDVDIKWYNERLCYSDALLVKRSDTNDEVTEFWGIPSTSDVAKKSLETARVSMPRDVEKLVVGPPGSHVRDLLAHTFIRARHLSRVTICPETIIPIMLKLAEVLEIESPNSSSVDPSAKLAQLLKKESREVNFPLRDDLMDFHTFMETVINIMRKNTNRLTELPVHQRSDTQAAFERAHKLQMIYSSIKVNELQPLVHSACLQLERWKQNL